MEERKTLKNNQHQPTTRQAYHKIWTNFNKFVVRLDYPPNSWEEKVSLYCTHLATNIGVQSSTLRSYVSAIKSKLIADGYGWNQDLLYLSALVRGCKLKNDTIKVRLPISKNLLEVILFEVERKYLVISKQLYKCALLKAVYITLYYGLFRVGEIAEGRHTVKAIDVHDATNKNQYLFVLHSSKTHSNADRPQKIRIQADDNNNDNNNFSPVAVIDDYIQFRRFRLTANEAFFIKEDGTTISAGEIRTELREILSHLELKPELYDVHSFRIGRATDLHKSGVTIDQIQEIGRWKSNAVYKYLKP